MSELELVTIEELIKMKITSELEKKRDELVAIEQLISSKKDELENLENKTANKKIAMGKWRENNKERYKELCRKGQAKYRETHKEKYYLKKKAEREQM